MVGEGGALDSVERGRGGRARNGRRAPVVPLIRNGSDEPASLSGPINGRHEATTAMVGQPPGAPGHSLAPQGSLETK
jgi:hypothetical protein